jgi:protein AATF/BFR2
MQESEDEMEEDSEGDGPREEEDTDNERIHHNHDGGSEGELPSESDEEDFRPPPKKVLPKRKSPERVEDLSSALRIKRDEDRKKGKAVSRQIVCFCRFPLISRPK